MISRETPLSHWSNVVVTPICRITAPRVTDVGRCHSRVRGAVLLRLESGTRLGMLAEEMNLPHASPAQLGDCSGGIRTSLVRSDARGENPRDCGSCRARSSDGRRKPAADQLYRWWFSDSLPEDRADCRVWRRPAMRPESKSCTKGASLLSSTPLMVTHRRFAFPQGHDSSTAAAGIGYSSANAR